MGTILFILALLAIIGGIVLVIRGGVIPGIVLIVVGVLIFVVTPSLDNDRADARPASAVVRV